MTWSLAANGTPAQVLAQVQHQVEQQEPVLDEMDLRHIMDAQKHVAEVITLAAASDSCSVSVSGGKNALGQRYESLSVAIAPRPGQRAFATTESPDSATRKGETMAPTRKGGARGGSSGKRGGGQKSTGRSKVDTPDTDTSGVGNESTGRTERAPTGTESATEADQRRSARDPNRPGG